MHAVGSRSDFGRLRWNDRRHVRCSRPSYPSHLRVLSALLYPPRRSIGCCDQSAGAISSRHSGFHQRRRLRRDWSAFAHVCIVYVPMFSPLFCRESNFCCVFVRFREPDDGGNQSEHYQRPATGDAPHPLSRGTFNSWQTGVFLLSVASPL